MTPIELVAAFHTMEMQPPDNSWYMDTGSTSHLTNDASKLSNYSHFHNANYILVGNGTRVPIFGHGNAIISFLNHPFRLNNVYHVPNIIKDIISVKKFNRDNNNSIEFEFDPFGFTVKDLNMKTAITRCNSSGDLYHISASPTNEQLPVIFHTVSPTAWHNRLGHPTPSTFNSFKSCLSFSCNGKNNFIACNACSLGKRSRLPFHDSVSITYLPFDIIHADLWTSPISCNIRTYTILHFLMISPVMYGLSPSKISMNHSLSSFTSTNIFKHNFIPI